MMDLTEPQGMSNDLEMIFYPAHRPLNVQKPYLKIQTLNHT